MDVLLNGKTVRLSPKKVIGKGGEADIYQINKTQVLKLFKPPDHLDFEGLSQDKIEAERRILEHQTKLSAFPQNLPLRVIVPQDLVTDRSGRQIVGFTMKMLINMEVLLRYGERSFREKGVDDDTVMAIFRDLHTTVLAIHQANVVIGDFNDLNVLVKDTEAYIIDADSMQFGTFPCRVFTSKFVDPLLCDPQVYVPTLTQPHTTDSDWYAYAIMLMQSLLYVGPYGGIYRPKDKSICIKHDQRSLKRITIFHPEVRYPKPARPFGILPDDLLQYFHQVFEKDQRGSFPLPLIENLRWTVCAKCSTCHARGVCPTCVQTPAPAVKEVVTGKITFSRIFRTSGRILYADYQNDHLQWIYHQNDQYYREDGRVITKGPLDPYIRFRINGNCTILAKSNSAFVFDDKNDVQQVVVDAYGQLPLIDANHENFFFVENGQLKRIGRMGISYPEQIGEVLPNQTLFWVGQTMGFGFYRAGNLSRFFVFNPSGGGLNDSIKLPPIRGQLIDSTCFFGKNVAWFLTATQESGKTIHRVYLVNAKGQLLSQTEIGAEDGSWLGILRGKYAVGNMLFASTDDGIVRVELQGSSLGVTKEFLETARFVNSNTHLFALKGGLGVVLSQEIWHLKLR